MSKKTIYGIVQILSYVITCAILRGVYHVSFAGLVLVAAACLVWGVAAFVEDE